MKKFNLENKKPGTKNKENKKLFSRFSNAITSATGKPIAFYCAFLIILIWVITGPMFNFSDTWQLVINTGTTIITFLMVFVIQHSQNKDTKAIQIKLDELIAANSGASNRVVDIEEMTDEEIEVIKKFYTQLAESAKKKKEMFSSRSVDEKKQKIDEPAQALSKEKNTLGNTKQINQKS